MNNLRIIRDNHKYHPIFCIIRRIIGGMIYTPVSSPLGCRRGYISLGGFRRQTHVTGRSRPERCQRRRRLGHRPLTTGSPSPASGCCVLRAAKLRWRRHRSKRCCAPSLPPRPPPRSLSLGGAKPCAPAAEASLPRSRVAQWLCTPRCLRFLAAPCQLAFASPESVRLPFESPSLCAVPAHASQASPPGSRRLRPYLWSCPALLAQPRAASWAVARHGDCRRPRPGAPAIAVR